MVARPSRATAPSRSRNATAIDESGVKNGGTIKGASSPAAPRELHSPPRRTVSPCGFVLPPIAARASATTRPHLAKADAHPPRAAAARSRPLGRWVRGGRRTVGCSGALRTFAFFSRHAGGVRCLGSTCRRSVGPNPPLVTRSSHPRRTITKSPPPARPLSCHRSPVDCGRATVRASASPFLVLASGLGTPRQTKPRPCRGGGSTFYTRCVTVMCCWMRTARTCRALR
jgi:hypothetical protein